MRPGVRVGVVLTILAAAAGPAQASGSTGVEKPLWQQSQDYWTTLAAPRVAPSSPDGRVGRAAEPDWFTEAVQQHHTGFPPAAQELARREAVASRTGQDPAALLRKSGAEPRQQARLLTLLVEFNPDADDDFSGWSRPDHPSGARGLRDRAGRHAAQRSAPQRAAGPGRPRQRP
jgi:immune inhibitor A